MQLLAAAGARRSSGGCLGWRWSRASLGTLPYAPMIAEGPGAGGDPRADDGFLQGRALRGVAGRHRDNEHCQPRIFSQSVGEPGASRGAGVRARQRLFRQALGLGRPPRRRPRTGWGRCTTRAPARTATSRTAAAIRRWAGDGRLMFLRLLVPPERCERSDRKTTGEVSRTRPTAGSCRTSPCRAWPRRRMMSDLQDAPVELAGGETVSLRKPRYR